MNEARRELEALRRAFAARDPSLEARKQCPEPEQLFEAASGHLDREQRLKIIDHVSQCAECAEAWRLARETGAGLTGAPERAKPAGMWRFGVAASVICGVGLAAYFVMPGRVGPPAYREAAPSSAPVALVQGKLARDRFLLRWSPGPPGATYLLRLTTSDLTPLLVKQDLESNELLVPGDVLQRVASGEQLLWQVEARLPDDQRIASDTFVITVE